MASTPYKCYWDACVFLSYIEGHAERIPVINAIIHEVEKKEVEIYTSTLSITEVAFAKAEKDGKALDPDIEAKIDKLWLPASPFTIVDIFETLTFGAKALIRQSLVSSGPTVKPADAIHIATAQHLGVNAIHTYDDKIQKCSSLVSFPIEEPRTDQIVWDKG